jgi:antitoxin component YwqK of YwqJK toxin-antitoxin module
MLAVCGVAVLAPGQRPAASRLEHRETYWPNGLLKSAGTFLDDVRHGEHRTFRQNGRPYELRHFDRGRESGLQQSWEEDGTLFLNYEMRNGRRYGFVNASPCVPAGKDGASTEGPS